MGGLEDLRHIECQFITEAVDGFYFSLCACGFHFLSQVLHLGVNEIKLSAWSMWSPHTDSANAMRLMRRLGLLMK